ncbi:MAG: tetratricopeptide repeat protein, partial [Candidatus Aureabacteria bacterium]|nr:tetratricopeptide repeat protein [Candidatus Auribacterota bacterium]
RPMARAVVAVTVILAAALLCMTWRRCTVWGNNLALWDSAVRAYPGGYTPVPYFNRGIVYTDLRRWDLAAADFQQALALHYRKEGRPRAYLPEYETLLSAARYPELYQYLAEQFIIIGQRQEAIGCLNAAQNSGLIQPAPH